MFSNAYQKYAAESHDFSNAKDAFKWSIFSRDKISWSEFENLRRHDDEMLIHKDCNVTEKQLNSVTETVDCK